MCTKIIKTISFGDYYFRHHTFENITGKNFAGIRHDIFGIENGNNTQYLLDWDDERMNENKMLIQYVKARSKRYFTGGVR